MRRVAIVGGGFSGAVCALQLARRATKPVAITLYEPRPMLGGGVAYSTADPAHRINVPAAVMTVFAEDERHFERWLKDQGAAEADPDCVWPDGQLYPARLLFGRYVAELVEAAGVRHAQTRIVAVERGGDGYVLALEHGGSERADLVVLAVSHPPPVVPASLGGLPGIIGDPWAEASLEAINPKDDIVIMGTGLTMADVVASLDRKGHRGHITAFSRHGLVSRSHPTRPAPPFRRFGDMAPPLTARLLLREVRRAIADAEAAGSVWQAVFDDLRINAIRLWPSLALAERQRFLRHLRSFWDANRYRIAPQIGLLLAQKQQCGSLDVLAASLADAAPRDGRLGVTLRPRGSPPGTVTTVSTDHLIVTTGPGHAGMLGRNPVLASLAEAGLIQADPVGLGILVDPTSRVIATDGTVNPTLLVAGPLARDTFGELMGLPQVSFHADLVAREVAAWL